jgi:hypothetical protein
MRIIGFFILVISSLYSYPTQAQKFSIGAKAGVLLTYPNFADAIDHQNTTSFVKPGFSAAGLIIFPLKKDYSFQSEAGFSQQGRKVKFTNIGTHYNNSTYYFADFAMGLRKTFPLKIKKNVASNWFASIGPNINYWMGGKGKIDTDHGIRQDYKMVFDSASYAGYDKMLITNANRWLFGLNLGFGFNATTLRNQKIMTEFRVTWGQTYLGKSNSASLNLPIFQTEQQSLKFNLKVISLSVAYIFDKDLRKAQAGKSDLKKRQKN